MRLKEALSAKPMESRSDCPRQSKYLDSLRDAPPSLRILPASEEIGFLRRLTARTQCHREFFTQYVFAVQRQYFSGFLFQHPVDREFHASVRTGAEQKTIFSFWVLFSPCENSKEARLIKEFKIPNASIESRQNIAFLT